jgi:hypothetical protein
VFSSLRAKVTKSSVLSTNPVPPAGRREEALVLNQLRAPATMRKDHLELYNIVGWILRLFLFSLVSMLGIEEAFYFKLGNYCHFFVL